MCSYSGALALAWCLLVRTTLNPYFKHVIQNSAFSFNSNPSLVSLSLRHYDAEGQHALAAALLLSASRNNNKNAAVDSTGKSPGAGDDPAARAEAEEWLCRAAAQGHGEVAEVETYVC